MSPIFGFLFIIAAIFAEIAGFIIVGRSIGVFATLILLVCAMLVGVVLLRAQGKGIIQRIRKELERGHVPDRHLLEGLMLVIASVLLIIPGFISDIFGLLLFLPPLRALLWHLMAKYVTSSIKFTPYATRGTKNTPDDIIIELDEDEYQAQGNEKSPWRQLDDKKNT